MINLTDSLSACTASGILAYAKQIYHQMSGGTGTNVEDLLNEHEAKIQTTIKLNEYDEVNVTHPFSEEHEGNILCNLEKNDEKIIQDHPDWGSEFADYVSGHNVYIATNMGNNGIGILGEGEFGGYEIGEEIGNVSDSSNKSVIVDCFPSDSDYWIIETETELTINNMPYHGLARYYQTRNVTPFRLDTDGSLHLMNVGGYNGDITNIDQSQSLQEVLNDLGGQIVSANTIINHNFTENNSIKIGTTINVSGTDNIAGGAGVSLTGNRVFGYGTSMGAIYLTGDKGTYSARLYSTSNYTNQNNIADAFATTHLNSYLLKTSDFSRVAKITNIVYNGENQPLTLTLDTDLGNLSNAIYGIENVAGTKSFNGGSFGNTGQFSSVIGLNNFNKGNYSSILGSINNNNGTYSTVLGYLGKNTGNYSSVIGSMNNNAAIYSNVIGLMNTNDSTGTYSNIIGRNNTNKCSSTSIIGISNTVNETTYPSVITGYENIADVATQQFTLGYGNHGTRGQYAEGNASASWMIGHHLTTSSGCWVLGKYNKDYDVQDIPKQNFFVIGQGDTNAPLNSVELKRNGNLYIFNVGGFNGKNSQSASTKSLQEVLSQLNTDIQSVSANTGGGSGSDSDSYLSLDEDKNLLVNEDYITVDGSDNLLKASAYISYNLSGSSNQYELELYGDYMFKDLHYQLVKFLEDAEILDEGGETVATITNASYESSTKNITITTSVDLGELHGDVFYSRNLNIADGCCCLGGFLNKGSYSSLIGYDNYNTGNASITLGNGNANDGQETVIVGNYNSIQNEHNGYPCFVFGDRNKVNDNSMLYVLGANNESTGNYLQSFGLGGSIKFTRGVNVGNDNLNQVGIGIGLDISQNEFVFGQFNKDYDIAGSSKKNFFTVGNGTEFTKSNSLEQKVNGDLYVLGLGGFDGTNSTETTTKSLQAKITELENRIAQLESLMSGGNS